PSSSGSALRRTPTRTAGVSSGIVMRSPYFVASGRARTRPALSRPRPGAGTGTLDPMALRFLATRPHPALLLLPWDTPLEQWDKSLDVPLSRGISRHVVRFVRVENEVYAVKETRPAIAEREYRMLRHLGRLGLPVV